MFELRQKGSVQYLHCINAAKTNLFVHAFCTRRGGVSQGAFAELNVSSREGDDDGNVGRNLALITAAFGISPRQLLLLRQVHGDGVLVVDAETSAKDTLPPEGDAAVTDCPGVALGIKTADCVPVFLVDPIRVVVGAVHAGWKGTALQIVKKAVGEMARNFGSCPADLIAHIGPAIGSCCYEVDEVVFTAISRQQEAKALFQKGRQSGRWMLDLPLANRRQLLECGLQPKNVLTVDYCTACNPYLFFSHRAQKGHTGRQLNFIMIRPAS